MFTGIVDHVGSIKSVEAKNDSRRILVHSRFSSLVEGESISVNGACMTVIKPEGETFTIEISPESVSRTELGNLRPGSKVNLERALSFSDRIGGHLVTGHIDETAWLKCREQKGEFVRMHFEGVSVRSQRFLLEKGSIAISGVSLTINQVFPQGFEVMLIPHTLERTTLGGLVPETKVNIEFDWMMKVILNEVDSRLDLLKGRL